MSNLTWWPKTLKYEWGWSYHRSHMAHPGGAFTLHPDPGANTPPSHCHMPSFSPGHTPGPTHPARPRRRPPHTSAHAECSARPGLHTCKIHRVPNSPPPAELRKPHVCLHGFKSSTVCDTEVGIHVEHSLRLFVLRDKNHERPSCSSK